MGKIGGRALASPASREEGREVQEGSTNTLPRSVLAPLLFDISLSRRLTGGPEAAWPRRTGTGAATSGSSLRRSWSSRSLSKSSICIRNASHNWSTQRRRRFTCADSGELAAAADSDVRRCDPSSVARAARARRRAGWARRAPCAVRGRCEDPSGMVLIRPCHRSLHEPGEPSERAADPVPSP